MKKNLHLYILYCLLFYGSCAIAQKDSGFIFRFILNPTNSLFNQHTLEIEHPFPFATCRVGVGIFTPYCWWNPDHDLYNGTDDSYPTGVYHGWMVNGSLLKSRPGHRKFLQFNLFFKYLWYDNVLFENSFGDPNPYVAWRRSEITKVLGAKVLFGKRKYLSKHLALESVIGGSMRCRFRSYVDWWRNQGWSWGINNRFQIFPGFQLGLLLVIGDFKI